MLYVQLPIPPQRIAVHHFNAVIVQRRSCFISLNKIPLLSSKLSDFEQLFNRFFIDNGIFRSDAQVGSFQTPQIKTEHRVKIFQN